MTKSITPIGSLIIILVTICILSTTFYFYGYNKGYERGYSIGKQEEFNEWNNLFNENNPYVFYLNTSCMFKHCLVKKQNTQEYCNNKTICVETT